MASVGKQVLQAAAAITAVTTTGTTVPLKKRQANFVAFLNVSACHADTTVAVKIQHSPDGSLWYDHTSFTNVVGAAGAEPKNISAPVLPNVRSVITLSGTTKSATVAVDLFNDYV